MSSIPDRIAVRARFLRHVGQTSPNGRGPDQLCLAALATLTAHRVSMSVISGDDGLDFLCASDDVAERMEWAQIALGQGPAVEAFSTGGPIATPDASAPDTRWPVLAREAEAAEAGPVYALPLQIGAIRVGVLSLYLVPGTELNHREFDDAIAIADVITSLLLASGTTHGPDLLDHRWAQPQSSREIHQATGMLVAQLGVSVRDAYARLQGYAFVQGRGLDEVAAEIVHAGLRIETDSEDDQHPAS